MSFGKITLLVDTTLKALNIPNVSERLAEIADAVTIADASSSNQENGNPPQKWGTMISKQWPPRSLICNYISNERHGELSINTLTTDPYYMISAIADFYWVKRDLIHSGLESEILNIRLK